MSVIGGQNIPVTNGLVYALDFGNSKSYSSGSTSAKSLQFNLNNFSISGSPSPLVNAIELGTSKYLSQPNIFTFNPNQDFTIQITGRPLSSGTLISTNTTSSKFILTYGTSSIIGFQTPTDTYTKQITGIPTSSVSAITYRYRSGSFDFFVNGLPVSASTNTPSVVFLEPTSSNGVNNYMFINGFLSLNSNLNTSFVSGSLSTTYFYNRALTSDEIYQNLLSNNTRSSLGLPSIKPYSLDENTILYVSASGITNTTTVNAVDTFIRGLKSASLWDKMVAIYPLISGSNNSIVSLKDIRISGTASLTTSGLSGSFVNTNITPSTYYPNYTNTNAHISILSYDTPNTQSALIGTSNSQYASGGQIFYTGSNVIHVFTGSGYFKSYVSMSAQVMVVAGGGGGGNFRGAGGGAGGLVYSSSYQIPQGTYNAIIGLGGLSSNQSFTGQNGEDSVFGTIRAFGGGGGGGELPSGQLTGRTGGSGGGSGGASIRVGGAGTPGQGNNGGDGTGARNGGTGGGGAGTSASFDSANGGSGSYFPQFTITGFGSPTGWFAGGGGGAQSGIGGIGGGGNDYASGVANTGGGSGAIWNDPGATQRGGSGIIIISYDTSSLTVPSSSFSITTDSTSITGSINNIPTSGITTSGPLGLITVSRTGSNSLTITKNLTITSFTVPASGALSSNLYLGAINNNNTASAYSPYNIAYASVGTGLTTNETLTYNTLVSKLQYDLGRGLLIEGYPAAAAYSVRQLSKTAQYSMEVRRDWDNASSSFGFTSNGDLDTGSLLAFVTGSAGTGSGFVKTWYDQSGNNRHATQTTASNQPLVVRSGSITTQGSKVSLSFSSSFFDLNSRITLNDFTTFWVAKKADSSTARSILLVGDNDNHYAGDYVDGRGTPYFNSVTGGQFISTVTGNTVNNNGTTFHLAYANRRGTQAVGQYNGLTTSSYATVSAASFLIDGISNYMSLPNYRYSGSVSEIIIHNTDQSANRSTIESNINSYFNIY